MDKQKIQLEEEAERCEETVGGAVWSRDPGPCWRRKGGGGGRGPLWFLRNLTFALRLSKWLRARVPGEGKAGRGVASLHVSPGTALTGRACLLPKALSSNLIFHFQMWQMSPREGAGFDVLTP